MTDDVVVTVVDGTVSHREITLGSSFDDAEERSVGSIARRSADLELVNDGPRGDQVVGLRYSLPVDQGVTLLGAELQFAVDEASFDPASFLVRTEDDTNADPIAGVRWDLSRRLHEGPGVPWSPPNWPFLDAKTMDQRTPSLISIVQPIIDRGGWSSGNAMLFLITGEGTRTAESFDGSMAKAPRLRLWWTESALNTLPTMDAGPDQVVGLGSFVRLEGRAYDREGADGDLDSGRGTDASLDHRRELPGD